MAPASLLGGFDSRWRTVRGLRLHALESAGGRGFLSSWYPGW